MNDKNTFSTRLPGLDTLRALAITWVLLTHYSGFVSGQQTFGAVGRVGWAGVDLFFVLSGYLVGRQVAMPIAHGHDWSAGDFMSRRLLRTLPNYLVVLLVYFMFPGPPLEGSSTAPLWRFLTFTQNFGLTYGATFTHSWSLCIEEQFYLVLPLAALAWARWGRSPLLAWLALGAAVALGMAARAIAFTQHGHGAFDAEVYYSTFCRFDELLPGVAIALLESFHPMLLDTLRRHGHALLFSGILSSVAVLYGIANELPGPFFATTFGYSLLAIAFSLLTLAALSPSSLLHRMRVPGASSLALWSYAIYLVHKPLFMVIAPQMARWHADPATWPVIIAVMTSGVGAGWILYRLVETPFMRMRSRWFPTQALTGVTPSRNARSLPDVHGAQTVG
jgi:peptidoglycan/LPS O-acetylase OafA/YrhL